jgi:guanylate kinase
MTTVTDTSRFVCIVGPKAGFKSTVAEKLLAEFPQLELVRSYTTRTPRSADEKGHIFISDNEFTRLAAEGDITVEAQVMGEDYRVGLSLKSVQDIFRGGKTPLLVTRAPDLIREVQMAYPNSLGIFLWAEPISLADRILFREPFGFNEIGKSPLRSTSKAQTEREILGGLIRSTDVVASTDKLTSEPGKIPELVDSGIEDIMKHIRPRMEAYLNPRSTDPHRKDTRIKRSI